MILRDNLDFAALAKSVLVHVTVITLCLVSWQCSEERLVKMPAHVKAVVVSKGSIADRPMMKSKPQEQPPKKITQEPKKAEQKKPEPPKPQPKKAEPPKPEPKKPEPVKPEPVKKPEPKPQPKKPEPKKPEPKKPEPKKPEPKKPDPKKPEPKKTPNFDDLIDEELDDLAKPTKPTKSSSDAPSASTSPVVDKYLAGIRADIERRWSRPPLSRNGMQVTLRLYLLPGGELNDVQVVVSSGNAAFDRSALAAVQKVGRFTVPSDPVEFDRDFRQFTVLFNPDDLTY